MKLSAESKEKIVKICGETNNTLVYNLRIEGNTIRFKTYAGKKRANEACKALLEAGLQSTPDDGKPEFEVSGTEGANRVDVKWFLNPKKALWSK